jgi:hypothetical protein
MRSMVEGADRRAESGIRPLHRLRRSPSPASRGEEIYAVLKRSYSVCQSDQVACVPSDSMGGKA